MTGGNDHMHIIYKIIMVSLRFRVS
jgi:hypothetical protein